MKATKQEDTTEIPDENVKIAKNSIFFLFHCSALRLFNTYFKLVFIIGCFCLPLIWLFLVVYFFNCRNNKSKNGKIIRKCIVWFSFLFHFPSRLWYCLLWSDFLDHRLCWLDLLVPIRLQVHSMVELLPSRLPRRSRLGIINFLCNIYKSFSWFHLLCFSNKTL